MFTVQPPPTNEQVQNQQIKTPQPSTTAPPTGAGQAGSDRQKLDVFLTMGGIYPVIPIKAEYKKTNGSAHGGQDYETIQVAFKVSIGYQLSCWVRKTLFLKETDTFNEEMNYLLKFIAPDLLGKEYVAASFKDYAEKVCVDINNSLQAGRNAAKEAKESGKTARVEELIVFGKLLRQKNSQYVEFAERWGKNASFAKDYLALPSESSSLYFTPWEIENTILPFAVKQSDQNGQNGYSRTPAYADTPTSASSWAGQNSKGDNDDLPF